MNQPTIDEVLEGLTDGCTVGASLFQQALAERIRKHGIAPPNGWVLVPVQDPAVFTEWLCREMPAGTIIGDANWWAKRILRRFIPQAAAPKPEVKL